MDQQLDVFLQVCGLLPNVLVHGSHKTKRIGIVLPMQVNAGISDVLLVRLVELYFSLGGRHGLCVLSGYRFPLLPPMLVRGGVIG